MEISSDEGCVQMQSLPDSMERLTLLERLVLRNLEVQSSPKSLKQLINLQTLEINNCPIGEFTFKFWSNLKEIILSTTKVSKISISDDCCPNLKDLTLECNHQLSEVDTLPTSVEHISVWDCELLRNISIGSMVNLQYLILKHCPELDTLPSFDKFASLKVFTLQGVNKVETIQGLGHCTSLEELVIEGKCWEVSSIESWEQVQRLSLVHLVAKKRSAVERCIQTIQKWPDYVIICTEAVAGAGSLLSSSAFTNLSVVHEEFNFYKSIKFDFNPNSDGNAMMLCLVLNCVSESMGFYIRNGSLPVVSGKVEEGKWTLIGVFTQRRLTEWPKIKKVRLWGLERNGVVERGMVVRGEDESVVEGCCHLLALLTSS
ncbi:hypothetical protein SUGI_0238810 [Cryptomeria japonica]|nr:hypothetical protein SUGI_0238810 [Cryptomeria japonica]